VAISTQGRQRLLEKSKSPNSPINNLFSLIKPRGVFPVQEITKCRNMKKLMVLASVLFVITCSIVSAQDNTPRVDKRQDRQQARIREGIGSGEVTRAEARRLRAEQRHIRRAERRAKADGEVTVRERARLERRQNKVSRDIRRQKHDRQN
jgi:hypothetical protein